MDKTPDEKAEKARVKMIPELFPVLDLDEHCVINFIITSRDLRNCIFH